MSASNKGPYPADFVQEREGHVSPKFVRRIIQTKKYVQISVTVKTIGISFFAAFISFYMIQVVWGSWFHDNLPDIHTVEQSIYWIQILLLMGIFSGFGISIVTFLILGEEQVRSGYKNSQRIQMIKSALFSLVLTFFIMEMIAYLSMYDLDPTFLYPPGTNIAEALLVTLASPLKIIAYFVIYIYPYPSEFWIITIVIYFILLTIIFIEIVPPSIAIEKKKREKRFEDLRQTSPLKKQHLRGKKTTNTGANRLHNPRSKELQQGRKKKAKKHQKK
jgi:hypothetical protein